MPLIIVPDAIVKSYGIRIMGSLLVNTHYGILWKSIKIRFPVYALWVGTGLLKYY